MHCKIIYHAKSLTMKMITKIEERKFEAKMSFGNGYSDWLLL